MLSKYYVFVRITNPNVKFQFMMEVLAVLAVYYAYNPPAVGQRILISMQRLVCPVKELPFKTSMEVNKLMVFKKLHSPTMQY